MQHIDIKANYEQLVADNTIRDFLRSLNSTEHYFKKANKSNTAPKFYAQDAFPGYVKLNQEDLVKGIDKELNSTLNNLDLIKEYYDNLWLLKERIKNNYYLDMDNNPSTLTDFLSLLLETIYIASDAFNANTELFLLDDSQDVQQIKLKLETLIGTICEIEVVGQALWIKTTGVGTVNLNNRLGGFDLENNDYTQLRINVSRDNALDFKRFTDFYSQLVKLAVTNDFSILSASIKATRIVLGVTSSSTNANKVEKLNKLSKDLIALTDSMYSQWSYSNNTTTLINNTKDFKQHCIANDYYISSPDLLEPITMGYATELSTPSVGNTIREDNLQSVH